MREDFAYAVHRGGVGFLNRLLLSCHRNLASIATELKEVWHAAIPAANRAVDLLFYVGIFVVIVDLWELSSINSFIPSVSRYFIGE